jgi:hypothetical protein
MVALRDTGVSSSDSALAGHYTQGVGELLLKIGLNCPILCQAGVIQYSPYSAALYTGYVTSQFTIDKFQGVRA